MFLVPVCASGHRHEEVQDAEGLDIKPQPVNVATLGEQAHMRSRVLASLPRSSVAKRPHTSFDSMSYMLLFPWRAPPACPLDPASTWQRRASPPPIPTSTKPRAPGRGQKRIGVAEENLSELWEGGGEKGPRSRSGKESDNWGRIYSVVIARIVREDFLGYVKVCGRERRWS